MPDRADRGLECPSPLPVLRPDLQISFYQRLQELRGLYLYDALQTTYAGLDIPTLDRELAAYVPAKDLRRVASFGLRGEVFFAVPCLLRQNPRILGYYRLLYGLSQKEFYRATTFGCLRRLEEAGDMSPALEARLDELCASLAQTGAILVDGIEPLSLSVAQELQLLTIGPQLRGGQNARLGQGATAQVFKLIADLVRPYVTERTKRLLRLRNSSGRIVEIEFSSDPDIRVTEQLESGVRKALAMEIKGGTDVSNVHNRLGEAEKSHQKAKALGFAECWTVVRIDVDDNLRRRESPSTSRFYHLDRIQDPSCEDYQEFRGHLGAVLGIAIAPSEADGDPPGPAW